MARSTTTIRSSRRLRIELMRPLLALLLLQAFGVGLVHAKEQLIEVVVAEPYLEMHSGPGRGFPVVYVVGRDEIVTVLYSRTDAS